MATGRGLAPRTHRIGRGIAVAAVAAGACWLTWTHVQPRAAGGEPADPPPLRDVASSWNRATPPRAPAPTILPAPLAGAQAPRLPVDAQRHLAHRRAVRDFFDYFLTARNATTASVLDALVKREIAAQLNGTAAQSEAIDVWQRYNRYRAELAKLPDSGAPGGQPDPAALQRALDQRLSLASRTLGGWSDAFFGDEQARQRYDLARLAIANDPSLTHEQKAERIAALVPQMPPSMRADETRAQWQRNAIEQIAGAQRSGASPDAMQAQLAQTLGPQAADRAARTQRDDDAWKRRYAAYAAQLALLRQQNPAQQDRDAAIDRLRQQYFTNPAERLRAASLDPGN